jgi:hypothetical protein
MTSMTLLAELHVREFVSRQKRLDELSRDETAKRAKDCAKPRNPAQDWRQSAIRSAGPMFLLDAVGQAEESWLELFEHAPRCELPEPETAGEARETEAGLTLRPA